MQRIIAFLCIVWLLSGCGISQYLRAALDGCVCQVSDVQGRRITITALLADVQWAYACLVYFSSASHQFLLC